MGLWERPARSVVMAEQTPPGQCVLYTLFKATPAWSLLPKEERRRMMAEHIRTGHKFPGIRINTAYSFGLDDQDFVVAFEGDDPKEFVTLLMRLRETEASRYTVRDTPQHTCARRPLEAILAALG